MSTNYYVPSLLVVVATMTFPLHISISNQSLDFPESIIEVQLDGKQIFNMPMKTDGQHNWEEKDVSISEGKHSLFVKESKTNVNKSMEINIDREQWVVIKFLGPKSGFVIDIEDQQVGYL